MKFLVPNFPQENFAEKGLSKLEHQQNDDVYIYSADSDYISNPNQMSGYWIPKEKVEEESVLKSGRMMVVSKAYLTDGNQRNAVAVKALKSNLSKLYSGINLTLNMACSSIDVVS